MGELTIRGARGGGGSAASIENAVITLASSTFVYDGNTKTQLVTSVVLNGNTLTEGTDYYVADNTAINAGTHTLSILGVRDYCSAAYANWTIARQPLTKPTITSSGLTYNTTAQTPTVDANYNSSLMRKDGDTSATNAGDYTLEIVLTDTTNYMWVGGTDSPLELDWDIAKRSITRPSVSTTPISYDGTLKTPSVTGYSSTTMSQSGDTDGTVVDSYTLTISLQDTANNKWDNNTIAPIDYPWYITQRVLTVPAVTSTHTYTPNTAQSPTLDANFISSLMTKGGDTSKTNAGDYTLTVSLNDTANNKWANNKSNPVSIPWSIDKATGSVSVNPTSLDLSGVGSTDTIAVTKTGDGALSVSSSDTSVVTATISGTTVTVTVVGNGTANVIVTMAAGDNYYGASAATAVTASTVHIYGVSWPKTSTTALSRTDDAALFTDPVPALSGGTGSSPFDSCLPWSGMVKETISGNVMVKIPKFYYKWTDASGSLKLQIADNPVDGFHTSPAHADRGDGKGERDYVYIGRYHCDTNYKSTTGASPKVSITRATARTGCKGVGTGFSQLDYAMWWTVRMLYLVEFADWNSQAKIGYGCGNNSARQNSGTSDAAKYHTGTQQSSRTAYGVGLQYRYIEDPWGNVYDWCDGIVISSRNPYVTNVIANYSDSTTNHTQAGTGPSSNNEISGWNVPTVSGLEWALFPNATVSNSSYNTYCADNVGAGNPCVRVGGYYNQYRSVGMFYSYTNAASSTDDYIGARLQYLP